MTQTHPARGGPDDGTAAPAASVHPDALQSAPSFQPESARPGSAQPGSSQSGSAQPEFDRHMLEALVCPVTHARLSYDPASQELVSKAAGLAYPIHAGIPIMLVTEARQIKAG